MYENTIPENVSKFLEEAAAAYGRYQADEFGQSMWQECCRVQSPIEQLFLTAIHLVAAVNLIEIVLANEKSSKKFEELEGAHLVDEERPLVVIPQWLAGKYRVDFALRRRPVNRIVCVELDGHEFHDRDERQRRYEKGRDRFFTVAGYSVLHFTGAEVVKDPCAVALEAFNLATGLEEVAIHPFELFGP